jgi:D-psicose/D-tagatose/L-ribulose 3-epimerase
VKCLLDYYHLMEENEPVSVIQSDPESLAHVHFSEYVGRVFPSGVSKQQYMAFFSELKQAGYDQRISIEAYSANFAEDARYALQLLKKIEFELNTNTYQ